MTRRAIAFGWAAAVALCCVTYFNHYPVGANPRLLISFLLTPARILARQQRQEV